MANVLTFEIIGKDGFSGAFGKLKSSLPSLKTLALGAGAGITAAGGALLAMTKSTATAFDAVQKFSDQLGVSTEFLSKMGTAAEFSGVQTATMNTALRTLQIGLGDAAKGSGLAKDALNQLNVSVTDANGNIKNAETIMPELARALDGVANASERAEIAAGLFGARGTEMLQLFASGSEGFAAMTSEAERFGTIVSADAGKNAAGFNDMLTRISMSFEGVRNAIAEKFMPILTELGNRFAYFVADNRSSILDFGVEFLGVMLKIVEYGGYAVGVLVDTFRGIKMAFLAVELGLLEGVKMIISGWSQLLSATSELLNFFKGPLVSGFDSVINFMVDKLISFIETFNFKGIFDGVITQIDNFKDTAVNGFDDAIIGIAAMTEGAGSMLNSFADTVGDVTSVVSEQLQGIIDEGSFTGKVHNMVQTIKTGFSEIVAASQETKSTLSGGIAPYDNENVATTMSNISTVNEAQQQAAEDINQMHFDRFASEREKEQAWFEEKLATIQGNQEAEKELYALHLDNLRTLDEEDAERQSQLNEQKLQATSGFLNGMAALANTFGEKHKKTAKAFAISAAIVDAYVAFNKTLASVPYPFNIVAAAGVLARGLATVRTIKGQAHDGMTNIPSEGTYILDKGERVLSPSQNEDLTQFLSGASNVNTGPPITINMNNEFFPNATNVDAMLSISDRDMDRIVEDKILPSIQRLTTAGVY